LTAARKRRSGRTSSAYCGGPSSKEQNVFPGGEDCVGAVSVKLWWAPSRPDTQR
jgi:hypothetical protein